MFTVVARQPCEPAGFRVLSRTPVILTVVVLLASVAVVLTITLIQAWHSQVLSPGLKYGVVLDAGSSRTTAYVYQWPAEKENNTGVVSQSFRCSMKGSGISSYDKNPQDVPRVFEDCMEKVREQVPGPRHASTHLYLGATAGMRLLRLQNETAANEILESIRDYFEAQPFDFRGAQIITGEEEGVYGWITANYLQGNFLERTLWHAWAHPRGAGTVGALDLGGASTQISFVAGDADAEAAARNGSGRVRVNLFGYSYPLYTHSFPCYGRHEAERRLLAALLQDSPAGSELINPCYPRNYSTGFTLGQIFGSLCTEKQAPASYNPGLTVAFRGTGDPSQCREKVGALFDFHSCQGQEDCSFDGVYQPKVQGAFVAFAGFYYTASALNLSGSFSLDAFNSSSWGFCSHAWTELPSLLPKFEEEYARSYCFSAHYIYHLLVNGYKFTRDTWPQIQFEKEVGNSSVGWALGYMLSLTNQIPAEAPLIRLPVSPPVFVGVLAFFTTTTLLCLAFLVYLCSRFRVRKSSEPAFEQSLDAE
ncbi:ectonucleoside triphosphate diphosphohydrolase 3 [Perognathus longimembris pacificus]|uniref:ectonucleoside triphosphate diphosphohydrolase 3 n=1 Tax=Perognathus longimembris pacificus TaxID=214514 RepID=UPI002018C400|nr:ectonucleoside triphosphate diphosphohydrolase 3 [Perognathus longimembris pacificus]